MTTPVSELVDAVRSALGEGVEVETNEFPSGAVTAGIRYGGRFVVLDGTADGEWGVGENVVGGDNAGYDEVHSSLADAVAAVARILGKETGSPGPPGPAW